MPVGDVVGEVFGGIFRFLARVLFEVVFELLIKGAGYLVIKLLKPGSEPEEAACAWVGLLFWVVLAGLAWLLYRLTAAV